MADESSVSQSSKRPQVAQADAPWWRGLSRDGQAAADQKPPLHWSSSENVIWRMPIPGRGHGSATVLGDQVFLTAADVDQDAQFVLAFDKRYGKELFRTAVHTGGLKTQGNKKQNKKASLASTTIATDSERLYVNFLNGQAVWTTALSLQGEILWQQKICDYIVHQGYGSSPAIFEDLVIVSADNKGGGKVVGLERATGQVRWQHERPKKPNYSSPIILRAAGKEQLIMTGCELVTSLDPATGKVNWEIEGATTECVTSTVTDGKVVVTSGGYPKNHIAAVAADGTGEVVWENNTRAYVPSLLYRDGFLYAVLDAGVATCLDMSDGSEQWKARLGGTFSSSPVMVGDNIYATNEDGETFVFAVNPEKYESIAKNKLGDNVFATPTICGGKIFARVALQEDGKRNEYLYCLGVQ
ncbi:outer membrane biogenesis protein BamB [Planctomycetes bacterium K23_9]|uniref:Outer membrane biogenesis protein BamB n=2 Tax=Stieleria marina TaxID=1930275 RepID=A0A517NZS1_9BACT|nr:outer membrane biogenesis protein BamB [Planctomycetes bacterium K23_9]